MTLAALNAMDDLSAMRALAQCCGSRRWTAAMNARRPFTDPEALFRAAEETWWSLEGADWLEAFAHHPRIGERAGGWAGQEQAGTQGAPTTTMRELASLNREYERKFGHVFLIFATGKSADEMLAELRRRLALDPRAEMKNAAAEQAKITRLRLEKLLDAPDPATARHS